MGRYYCSSIIGGPPTPAYTCAREACRSRLVWGASAFRVLTCSTCMCLDTTRLQFGVPPRPPVSNPFGLRTKYPLGTILIFGPCINPGLYVKPVALAWYIAQGRHEGPFVGGRILSHTRYIMFLNENEQTPDYLSYKYQNFPWFFCPLHRISVARKQPTFISPCCFFLGSLLLE